MWVISNLFEKLRSAEENRAYKTEMAGKPHLPLWRIFIGSISNFYFQHWKWIWTTVIAFVAAYAAVLQLACR